MNKLHSPQKSINIDLSIQPDPIQPEWSKGKFLDGIQNQNSIEVTLVTSMTWQHPFQSTNTISGSYILNGLVANYGSKKIQAWCKDMTPCPVMNKDDINAHYGIKALLWLRDNWPKLPFSQKHCLIGKTIYGLADIMFDENQSLVMPYVTFATEKPIHGWYSLSKKLGHNERFLVNPRAAILANKPVAEFIS